MKKNKYNFNYIFLFYDVNEKRVNKIFKICKKYLSHYQRSVFRGEISPGNLLKLKNELKRTMDEKYDSICIVKFINNNYFAEDTLGVLWKDDEDCFI
ncbi:CRISPR-associated endonuclease Cas2 [Fusobacterium sp.]|uniref:CRISPR-associated endonuclease Cas2 n=1 Tax=Fusobacterium sp. TaxID=68766 RepID=UPI00396C3663